MSAAVPTRVERSAGGHGWTLLRGGEPYRIRGVGGTGRCARAAALGANSVRTWSTSDLGAALDAAHAAGLTVCAGLWVRHANLGPGWYEDAAHAAERDAKLEEFRTAVRTHRNHPALLCWAVGNEPNANGFSAHAPLWRYVNALARMCKQEGAATRNEACQRAEQPLRCCRSLCVAATHGCCRSLCVAATRMAECMPPMQILCMRWPQ
jgi:hypothetical protein